VFQERGRYVYAPWDGTPVLPTIHPAYVLRRLGERASRADPSRDLFDDIEKLRREPYEGPETNYRIASVGDCLGWIHYLHSRRGVISLDLECDNRPWPGKSRYLVSPFRDRILCASFSWEAGKCLVVPGELLLAFAPEWRRLFGDTGITWCGHNLKFDFKMLEIWLGGRPRYPHMFDTLLAHYCLDERKGTHALKPKLVGFYFDRENWEPELIQKHVRARTVGWADIPKDDLYEYAAYDGDYERRLYDVMKDLVEKEGHEKLLDFLTEVTDTLIYLELQGAPIDLEKLDKVEEMHQRLADEQEDVLRALVSAHLEGRIAEAKDPDPVVVSEEREFAAGFNVRSVKQVAHYLYDIMGYTPPTGRTIRTKSGRSTNAESLEKLSKRHPDNEFFGTLREYRRHKKFEGTYCKNLRILAGEGADPDRPVFLPQYMLIGTETGRLAGSIGMTWPAAADLDMLIEFRLRSCFVAPPGKVWMKADYSQAELRLMGWYSGEPYLKMVYQEGRDLHNEVSLKLFGKSRHELESHFSRAVKAFNFRFAYLPKLSTVLFVEGMLLDPKKAEELTNEYAKMFPVAIQWKKDQIKKMERDQVIVSANGRHRRFPIIGPQNRDEYEKAAINPPVASLSSDLVLASIVELRKVIEAHPEWEAQMILLLHDEVDLLMKPEYLKEFAALARPIMEVEVPARFGIYPEDMPLRVDFSVGPSWGEVEEWSEEE
jgi:DNA polymerase I-like protein with 3'-5' exonuclease and polymerase domains